MSHGALTVSDIARATRLQETTVDALLAYMEQTGSLVRRVEAMCTGSCSLCSVAGECKGVNGSKGLTTLTLLPTERNRTGSVQ